MHGIFIVANGVRVASQKCASSAKFRHVANARHSPRQWQRNRLRRGGPRKERCEKSLSVISQNPTITCHISPPVKAAFFLSVLLLCATGFAAEDGNRFTYLEDGGPYYPNLGLARFTTPQWIGEPGVDAAVILSIDDLKVTDKYEKYLRPILERLKQIDGHAPFSIMCNQCPVSDPQFPVWLKEGVAPEVHTLTHPCPLLGKDGFDSAAQNYQGCVDLLSSIPENHPVAFRMPCCDSMNSASPRFFAEIFPQVSPQGHFLSIDSSVMQLFTPRDESLPRDLVLENGRERFRKYFPMELVPPRKVTFGAFAGYIEDYPYPYVIDRVCWEFPCAVPSDWEAFNTHGAKNPLTTADWKAALDATVIKQGVLTTILHPHGWSAPEQIVELIDYAVSKYGSRVKFLTFREALARIEKNALGGESLRSASGNDNGVRLVDLDGDAFMDVVIGNDHKRVTRIWQPREKRWLETPMPAAIVTSGKDGKSREAQLKFGMVRQNPAALLVQEDSAGAWEFRGGAWQNTPQLLRGLEGTSLGAPSTDSGIRLRDFDRDGHCELLVSNPAKSAIYGWSESTGRWQQLDYALPEGLTLVNSRGEDNGLRFVDLNGDGFDDVLFSDEHRFAIYLWAAHVREVLGWKRGWPHEVIRGTRGENARPTDLPPFVDQGRNNGAWLNYNRLTVQNEGTFSLEEHTWWRSFPDLIAFDMPPPKSPQDSLASIYVRPGFKVELVAAEPLIEDATALEWDAQGRLWVLEMHDYPLGLDGHGEPGGILKILEDTKHDGHYDKSTVFLDHIPFPSGLAFWHHGVLIASSPNIIYAEDTDGDGRADVQRVMFTGFKPGNQQHRLNGFDWGFDGWLYGANGDSGGKAKSVVTGQEVDISGRDFRFRPDSGEFETVSGESQYGRHRDDWGEWFGNNNSSWLWHFTVPENYLKRNPRLALKSVRRVLANDPDPMRVFAVSRTLPRFNQPDTVGFVTSANSATPYRDELFGPDFETSVFISEPVYNVVHREVLTPDGATFTSHRAEGEKDREFLASTDNWFRPTMLKTGPDGALYIADMYRAVLEHPEWIPPETQSRLDLRAGADRGRVYRVYPENASLRPIPNLAKLTPSELAAALDSPNGWQRDTAERLLLESEDRGEIPQIVRLASAAANPKVRLQALATLDLLNGLTPEVVMTSLRDAHPGVRREALHVSERFAGKSDAVLTAALALESDPDFSVRRQLAFSLGAWNSPAAAEALTRMADREGSNEQMRPAILSSVSPESPLMAKLTEATGKPAVAASLPKVAVEPNRTRAKVAESYAGVAHLTGNAVHGHDVYRQVCIICHKLKGEGSELGPDLGTVADKPFDWLLTAIFDPNAAVEQRYQVHRVTTKAGGEIVGLIVAETANNLTLRLPGGVEQTVLRADIKDRAPLGRSLMPDGLEAVLKEQDVADVISWIRAK